MKINTKPEKIQYTWEQFDGDVRAAAKQFSVYDSMIKTIYGVPKGGLPFAVKLAYLMNKKLILDEKKINNHTLVVDDILDSGKTLEALVKRKTTAKYFMIATLWKNKDTKSKLNVAFKRTVAGKVWVEFPWEE